MATEPLLGGRYRIASPALRRAQTLDELSRLDRELVAWARHRRQTDLGATDSQVGAVEREVRTAIQAVRGVAEKLDANGAAGEIFERWARIDAQIIQLRRAWLFFRSRFDQRDDPSLSAVLRAAEDVAWSCFKPFFQQTFLPRPLAPLACIELDYAPSTLLRHHTQALARPQEQSELLQRYFRTLPVPLLRLPPTVISAPWLLGIVGHEVGHALYPCIHEDGSFPNWFAEAVAQSAARAGAAENKRHQWQRWAPEIFADLYSVLMMGPIAVWLILQYEIASEARMSQPRASYPPANVRLFLIDRFWTVLDAGELPARTQEEDSEDYRIAAEVARLALLEVVPQKRALHELVDFRREQYHAELEQWSRALLGELQMSDVRSLRTVRLIAAAAVDAAASLLDTDITEGTARHEQLGEATLQRIVGNREEGKRAMAGRERASERTELATLLLQATDRELFEGVDGG